jgi:outer membrane protein TolC
VGLLFSRDYYLINMKNISLLFFYIIIISVARAQEYDVSECIKIALDRKGTLVSAGLDVESANQGVLGSYSGVLPSLRLSTSGGKTKYPVQESIIPDLVNLEIDTITSGESSYMSAGLSINQTIYNGGRSVNAIKQARINLDIAKLRQRNTKIEVIQNVTRSYYGLLQAQQLLDVAENNLVLSEKQVDLVQKQFDLGAVRKTDLLKAKVSMGQAKVELLNRKTVLENSRRQLFNDMGMIDFGQSIVAKYSDWVPVSVPTSAETLTFLKEKNPNILIQLSAIEIGKIQLKIAKGMRSPSAFASVDYSANGDNSDELKESLKDDWRLGMNMSINFPLYSGNSLSTAQQKAELEKQKSENDYLTYLNDLRVQVELIRKSIMNYSEIIPINQDVVASAEEDLKLVQKRYSIGSATILEVLDAQVSLIRSNSTLINTIHDARMQEMSLKALLGILDLEY